MVWDGKKSSLFWFSCKEHKASFIYLLVMHVHACACACECVYLTYMYMYVCNAWESFEEMALTAQQRKNHSICAFYSGSGSCVANGPLSGLDWFGVAFLWR